MSQDAPTGVVESPLMTVRDGKSVDLMSVYFWTDEEKRAFLLSRGVTPVGEREKLPDECPLCTKWIGGNYDIHMIFYHPETRPQPPKAEKAPKKQAAKKGTKRGRR